MDLLTDDERKAVSDAGKLFTHIVQKVIGNGVGREQDVRELMAPIHEIQRMVMAQAAARAYPEELRLLGFSVKEVLEEDKGWTGWLDKIDFIQNAEKGPTVAIYFDDGTMVSSVIDVPDHPRIPSLRRPVR